MVDTLGGVTQSLKRSPKAMSSTINRPPNSLEQFARTAEAVAATTKKLEKAALLGAYFEQLGDEDLARAARYFAGQQFALSDARTTNVGGSILGEAMVLATGVDPESLGPRYAARGRCGGGFVGGGDWARPRVVSPKCPARVPAGGGGGGAAPTGGERGAET